MSIPTLPPDTVKPVIEDYELKELDIRYNSNGSISSAWVVMSHTSGSEEIVRIELGFDLIVVIWSALIEFLEEDKCDLDKSNYIL